MHFLEDSTAHTDYYILHKFTVIYFGLEPVMAHLENILSRAFMKYLLPKVKANIGAKTGRED